MLEVRDLSVSYAGNEAVRGVSLRVAAGEMVGLIGPNGAGKSSLLNAISGVVPSGAGAVTLAGESIHGRAPHRIARAGLMQVPEGRQILGPLTVEENLLLGRLGLGRRRALADRLDQVFALFPVLAERRRQEGGSLSGGQQQMLAIGRALMGDPRVLMLDEPSLGLSPLVASQVFEALERLQGLGLTVLLVEQNARRALAVTQRAYVLEQGRIVAEGRSADLAGDPVVTRYYLPDRGSFPLSQPASGAIA